MGVTRKPFAQMIGIGNHEDQDDNRYTAIISYILLYNVGTVEATRLYL